MTNNNAPRKVQSRRAKERRRRLIGAIVFGITLVIGSWGASRLKKTRSMVSSPPPPVTPAAGSPSKEYIYAGGRLIATEEPNPSTLAAPANLTATTVSDVQIDISWTATPNAHHYQIERSNKLGDPFAVLNPNITTTTFSDTSVTAVNAYVYRVIAADASGNLSPTSNVDLATAINFEDDPLAMGAVVRTQHILQLRQAVNAARAAANLGPAAWTRASLQPGTTQIMAIDIEELRTALNQALSALSLPTGSYTDPSLSGQVIKRIHVTELRDRVK